MLLVTNEKFLKNIRDVLKVKNLCNTFSEVQTTYLPNKNKFRMQINFL